MKRAFIPADSGKQFRLNNPTSPYHGRIGELETFPLMDPGTAGPDEGILWFGPVEDRDGWDYVKPAQVQKL